MCKCKDEEHLGNFGSCKECHIPKAKPHKHAALIKAWADGAVIQVWEPLSSWETIDTTVAGIGWYPHRKYRIKPAPPVEPDYGKIGRDSGYPPNKQSTDDPWKQVANAIIEAYKVHQQALKEYNAE